MKKLIYLIIVQEKKSGKFVVLLELCNYYNMYKLWHHKDDVEKYEQLIDREIKKEDWY